LKLKVAAHRWFKFVSQGHGRFRWTGMNRDHYEYKQQHLTLTCSLIAKTGSPTRCVSFPTYYFFCSCFGANLRFCVGNWCYWTKFARTDV
jgi:hypothetical protein